MPAPQPTYTHSTDTHTHVHVWRRRGNLGTKKSQCRFHTQEGHTGISLSLNLQWLNIATGIFSSVIGLRCLQKPRCIYIHVKNVCVHVWCIPPYPPPQYVPLGTIYCPSPPQKKLYMHHKSISLNEIQTNSPPKLSSLHLQLDLCWRALGTQ